MTYEWVFTPEGGGAEIWDFGGYTEPLPQVRATTTSGTWSGTAAHGGMVVVSARDTTNATVGDTAHFSVADRGWGITATFTRGANLTNYVIAGAVLGENADAPIGGSSSSGNIVKGVASASVGSVASGPNHGYAYMVSQRYSVARFWRVNVRLTSSGPAEVPDVARGDTVNHWTYLARRGYSPQYALSGTMAHEGYGQYGAKGHQGQIEAALTTSACGDAASLGDRIVAETEGRARTLVDAVEDAAFKAVSMASSHYYVHNNHSGSPVAYFAPGDTTGSIVFHTDGQDRMPGYPTPVGCLWSF